MQLSEWIKTENIKYYIHRATGTQSINCYWNVNVVQALCGFLMKSNIGYLPYDLAVVFLNYPNALKT